MKASSYLSIILIATALTACGAKQSNTTNETRLKTPKDVVTKLSCSKTYKKQGSKLRITEESGSEGNIETPCSNFKIYKLNENYSNLNLVNVEVEKYFICKNSKGKGMHGWVFQHNLAKGESTFTLKTASKGDYLHCTGSFSSPLPRTVVSNEDIQQLINSRDESQIKNCEQSSKEYRATIESCSDEWTYGSNIIFTDDSGERHRTTRKKTWHSAKY